MSGVTLSDLSKYHQGAMKWFKDGLVSEHNKLFAQTEEAGAVSFWPLGGTPLEGKVKFSFKETPPASGDKGPENPSTISGVSSINVIKSPENLISHPYYYDSRTINGVTFTVGEDGSVTANGTATARIVFWLNTPYGYPILKPGVNYILSGAYNADSNMRVAIDFGDVSTNSYAGRTISDIGGVESVSFTVDTDYLARIYIIVNKGATVANSKIYPKLQIGNQLTPYKLGAIKEVSTISLGDTYYGGEIDLATGLMTVTWGATVIKGTESFSKSAISGETRSIFSGTFDIPQQTMCRGQTAQTRVCSHFPFDTGFNMNTMMTWETATNIFFTVPASEYPTKESFAEWLASEYSAGHPVTVGYKLHNPYTVQLTPLQLTALTQKDKYTPRMNTVYTDADSIQIRYRKSLIHDEDEKVQAIVALGGNV